MQTNNIPDPSAFRHRADIQLRFSDVDVLGHVNNTVYFAFYDTGKALYFTEVSGHTVDWRHVDRVIVNVDCAFIDQIVYGEQIEVLTRVISIGNKSFTMQQMLRDKQSGKIKSICTTVMVTFDPETHITIPVSAETRRQIETYENISFS